jgi:hypothetical protein
VEVKRDIRPPLVPRPTGPDGVTNDLQPALTWAQALDQQPVDVIASGVVAYRVRLNGTVLPDVPAPPDPGQPASLRVAQILPNGSTNSWTVQSIDGAGNVSLQSAPVTFQVDVSAPEPPSITAGPTNDDATSSASLTFSFTGEAGAAFSWELNDDAGQKIASSPAPAPASSASVGPLRDGAYSFRVRQVLPGNRLSGYAVAVFNVDTAAPGAPQVIQSPGTTTTVQPSFGWRAAESGGSFVWEVTGPGGAVVAGPGRVTADAVQLPALPAGAFVFRVRQRDRAGNLGDWSAPEPFTIIAAAGGTTTTPARRTTRVPATVNSRWLRPAKGGKVSPKRVTLRWRRVRAASLYNVQLFRVDGQRYTKVLGTFTRGTRYTVKGRYLRRNTRYVWRVWPYIARSRSYTRRALGISYFDTRAR